MREIKFRAWNKDEKKWCQVLIRENGLVANPNEHNTWKSIPILMQLTGLLDKNGKEIYEGDIVLCSHRPTGIKKAEVVFENGCFIVNGFYIDAVWSEPLEVVGNIYENPELINQGEL